MDTTGYATGEASAGSHRRTQEEVVSPQCCVPLSGEPPAQRPDLVFTAEKCTVMYFFFWSLSIPVKKGSTGNRETTQ